MVQSQPIPNATPAASGAAPGAVGLAGPWRDIAHALWLLLFALNLIWFVISVVEQIATIQRPCLGGACLLSPIQAANLRHAGISLPAFTAYFVGIPLLVVLTGMVLALLLFWRRSDDWFALLVGLFLLYPIGNFATGPNTFIVGTGLWGGVLLALALVDTIVYFSVFLLFPGRRFAPRWTWLLLVAWVGLHVAVAFGPQLGIPDLVYIPAYPLLYLSVIAVQVYRYRLVSTARQRQQTKWVVLGVAVALTANILYWIILPLVVPSFQQVDSLYAVVAFPLYELTTLALPVSFAVAIARNQLFDVDRLINRALVYGALSAILGGLYAVAVYTAQFFSGRLTGHATPAPWFIVVVTLAVAALFNPLRRRIQALIDRQFYRTRYDAARTLDAFAATLRSEVNLADLSARLIDVAQETMQPTQVSLWLRAQRQGQGDKRSEAATGADWVVDA